MLPAVSHGCPRNCKWEARRNPTPLGRLDLGRPRPGVRPTSRTPAVILSRARPAGCPVAIGRLERGAPSHIRTSAAMPDASTRCRCGSTSARPVATPRIPPRRPRPAHAFTPPGRGRSGPRHRAGRCRVPQRLQASMLGELHRAGQVDLRLRRPAGRGSADTVLRGARLYAGIRRWHHPVEVAARRAEEGRGGPRAGDALARARRRGE